MHLPGKPLPDVHRVVYRLFRSLAYVHIDPALSRDALTEATHETLERNLKRLDPGSDYAVCHVTRYLASSALAPVCQTVTKMESWFIAPTVAQRSNYCGNFLHK